MTTSRPAKIASNKGASAPKLVKQCAAKAVRYGCEVIA